MTVLAFQQRRLIRASEISDNYMGRHHVDPLVGAA